MWPYALVPELKHSQGITDGVDIVENHAAGVLLERSEEAFHSPVLPRTMQFCSLVADPQDPQPQAKPRRDEDCLVVGSQGARLSKGLDGIEEMPQQSDGGFGLNQSQIDQSSGSMVKNTQYRVRLTVFVGNAGAFVRHSWLE